MPPAVTAEASSHKKSKRKAREEEEAIEAEPAPLVEEAAAEEPKKKSKSKKSKEPVEESEDVEMKQSEAAPAPSGEKKRKKAVDTDAATTETEVPSKTKSHRPKADEEEKAPANPADVPDANGNPPISSFPISAEIRKALGARGITHMFPIQAKSFEPVMQGHDIIARARTGTGKTLGFALPIIEMLRANATAVQGAHHLKFGREPRALVLLPTRELAIQVAKEFELTGLGLSTVCVYGGSPMGPQQAAIRRGVDVVVGTTGRICDHLERKSLSLASLQVVVLDEADEMLNMGFQEDVENILKTCPKSDSGKRFQMMLFSATVPSWVQEVARKFMKPDRKTIDLVGNSVNKTSSTIRHLLIPVHYKDRAAVLYDVLRCYGGGSMGSAIVFTETKQDANELMLDAQLGKECQVLHGDIAQNQREQTLKGFRAGKFRCLVATDVAARGLDISGVDLVVQIEPPKLVETYIHRSGRTGRAGASGTCITFYGPKTLYFVQNIEKRAGAKFERVAVPSSKDILAVSATDAAAQIEKVDPAAREYFLEAAKKLIESKGPVEALASALAVVTGHTTPIKERSLLCANPDSMTVQFHAGQPIPSMSFVWRYIHQFIPAAGDSVSSMQITSDRTSAVFDIPTQFKADIDKAVASSAKLRTKFTIPTALPQLEERVAAPPPVPKWKQARDAQRGKGGGRGGYGGRGGGGGGGFGRPRSKSMSG